VDVQPVGDATLAEADFDEALRVSAYIHSRKHIELLTGRAAYITTGILLVETAGQDASHLHRKLARINALLSLAFDGTAGALDQHPA
jgi:hypothetical protein